MSLLLVGGMGLTLWLAAAGLSADDAEPGPLDGRNTPRVSAATPEEAGRYLVVAGGCNDCHTPGYMEADGHVPEAEWLTGVPVGWRGPWGTSYARNLRLTADNLTEAEWVARLRVGAGLPPMPWMNLRQLSDPDLVAIYRYIRSLGPAGQVMPAPLAPGVTPTTPYISLEPIGG